MKEGRCPPLDVPTCWPLGELLYRAGLAQMLPAAQKVKIAFVGCLAREHRAGNLSNVTHPLLANRARLELGILNPRRASPESNLKNRIELVGFYRCVEEVAEQFSWVVRADSLTFCGNLRDSLEIVVGRISVALLPGLGAMPGD